MPFPGSYTGGRSDWTDPYGGGGGGGYDVVHFEGTGDDLSKCGPGTEYSWVYVYFRACITTDLEFTGFVLGMLSNVCWLIAQGPQLWKNYKNGKADSLSFLFLAEWLTGDITNLIGCLLTNTTKTQLYTAAYFCVIDTAMVTQWLYYNNQNKKKKGRGVSLNSLLFPLLLCATPSVLLALALGSGATDAVAPVQGVWGDAAVELGGHHHGRALLGKVVLAHNDSELTGYILGCICAFLYFTSRIPQIVTNFRRKSCEGLSPLMFTMAVMGNVFYAAGVLTQNGTQLDIFLIRLPWLIGSVGTLIFDFTILVQYCVYGTPTDAEVNGDDAGVKQPLLKEPMDGLERFETADPFT